MYLLYYIWAGKRKKVVVALERVRMVFEQFPAKIFLVKVVSLYHCTHCAVKHKDPFVQNLPDVVHFVCSVLHWMFNCSVCFVVIVKITSRGHCDFTLCRCTKQRSSLLRMLPSELMPDFHSGNSLLYSGPIPVCQRHRLH